MSSNGEEILSEPEFAAAIFDDFPDEEIDSAVDAAGLLADSQVIDDLQIFPSVFDSGAGSHAASTLFRGDVSSALFRAGSRFLVPTSWAAIPSTELPHETPQTKGSVG